VQCYIIWCLLLLNSFLKLAWNVMIEVFL